MGRYYVYQQRVILEKVVSELQSYRAEELIQNLDQLELMSHITIAYAPLTNSINEMNETLIYQFEQKKIKLNKFWLTDETLGQLESGPINRLYDQGKTKYQFLTKFMLKDNYVFAIGITIPYINETVAIMTQFNFYTLLFSVSVIGLLVFLFARRMIQPLERLQQLSKDIAQLNFRTEEIKTNDEIEDLAHSINEMSLKLKAAQQSLNEQNQNLKVFISDISHELKTPIALIKSYAQGIEDGMDDGHYVDTIINQADEMSELIEQLLYLSKMQRRKPLLERFNLSEKLVLVLKKYELILLDQGITLNTDINQKVCWIVADASLLEIVLNNLMTNAIKYTTNQQIEVSLLVTAQYTILKIRNGTAIEDETELTKLWNPFYILEKSRNKHLSGTGLGLPLVKTILESHGFLFGSSLEEGWIEFYIKIPSVTDV